MPIEIKTNYQLTFCISEKDIQIMIVSKGESESESYKNMSSILKDVVSGLSEKIKEIDKIIK